MCLLLNEFCYLLSVHHQRSMVFCLFFLAQFWNGDSKTSKRIAESTESEGFYADRKKKEESKPCAKPISDDSLACGFRQPKISYSNFRAANSKQFLPVHSARCRSYSHFMLLFCSGAQNCSTTKHVLVDSLQKNINYKKQSILIFASTSLPLFYAYKWFLDDCLLQPLFHFSEHPIAFISEKLNLIPMWQLLPDTNLPPTPFLPFHFNISCNRTSLLHYISPYFIDNFLETEEIFSNVVIFIQIYECVCVWLF